MLREKTLEDERIKLSKITDFLNNQIEILNNLEKELQSLKENTNLFYNGNFNPMLTNNYNAYIAKKTNEILLQKESVKKAEIEQNKQKQQVQAAYVKVKILEKLKEKQKERYNQELMLEEIKFIDDIATSRKRA